MNQVNFVEDRPYHFKFFKDCLPQNLLGLFLNTLSQINSCQTLKKLTRTDLHFQNVHLVILAFEYKQLHYRDYRILITLLLG